VLFHPLPHTFFDMAKMIDAMAQQREHIMVTSAPTMSSLITSSAVYTPVVAARLARTRPNRIPIQVSGRRNSCGAAQQHVGLDRQFFQVDVRLVEAIEEHEAIGAHLVQLLGRIARLLKNGLSFAATGMCDRRASLRRECRCRSFQCPQPEYLGVGGDEVDIAFDGVGSGLLDLLGKLRAQPPSVAPLRLAMIGTSTAPLALRM
jgi:hypothetical protein